MTNKRGFISIPIILIITLFVGGAGVGIYKYKEVSKQNKELRDVILQKEETQVESNIEDNDTEIQEDIPTENTEPVIEIATEPVIKVATNNSNTEKNTTQQSVPQIIKEAPSIEALQFGNIEIIAEKEKATINWSTNIPTESRLVIHKSGTQEIFPSDQINSINHSVTILGLKPSIHYTYEIIAKTKQEEINTFDKFFTKREFITTLKEIDSDNCSIFIIKDTAGSPLISTKVRIISVGNVIYPDQIATTNTSGELKYCKSPEKTKIVDFVTGEIYKEA